jgi:putative FmdB family regulatory protein
MPTYEYLCQACSHRFEQWQKMIDDPLTICPECGGHIRRVFFPAGIVFKGSGFYKTDHRTSSAVDSNGNGNATKSEEAGVASESKSAGESKSASTEPGASSSSGSGSTSTGENKAAAATTTTTK